MYAKLALLSPPWSELTYALPEVFGPNFWQIGMRAIAPVGKSLRAGVIVSIGEKTDLPPGRQCKNILWPLFPPHLPGLEIVEMVLELAARQGAAPGFILGHALPPGLRKSSFTIERKIDCRKFDVRALAALPEAQYRDLAADFMAGRATFAKKKGGASICFSAIGEPPWPLRPAAKKQMAILDYLYGHGRTGRGMLVNFFGSSIVNALAKLVRKGLVKAETDAEEEGNRLMPPPAPDFILNAEQQAALQNLVNALQSGQFHSRLLYGVTGSGKTAVYLALARKCIEQGKSVLLLAPEVALAHKLHRDVKSVFTDIPVYLYHGYQAPAKREEIFSNLAEASRAVIVAGTRSSLFLPIPSLGCVIMDEEHDASYKQDDVFAYHARELAWFRMLKTNGLFVAGSATPDIRSFYASKTGHLPLLCLPKRVSGRSLPPLEVVPIGALAGKCPGADGPGLLAPECEAALTDCLRKGEQAVILLNRRGYAPLVYCVSCERTLRCPNCEIGMSFHKGLGRLVCHYCDFSLPWPGTCPHCGQTNFISIGEGTERIAERLQAIAGRPILRLDRDTARRADRIETILNAFANGESPFLVGTQMLSKGHHFPNVTLVVVADGDIGLNLPDYRATERTFQLLAQAAGRAGRGCKAGRALIQTRNPDHYCWQHIVNYDYESFYAEELKQRQKYGYPPFLRLGLLRISYPFEDEDAPALIDEIGAKLRKKAKELDAAMLGPAPAPLAMLKGRKRLHCLIKANEWRPMRQLWLLAQKFNKSKSIRILLDIDPVNMM